MKITVCLKQVIDTGIYCGFGKIDENLINKNLLKILNPDDAGALYHALQFKTQYRDTEIKLVSIGDSEVDNLLRDGLAMGADSAIRILYEGLFELTPYQKSLILSRVISLFSSDLILFGCRSGDNASGLTGPYVAARLGYTFVYGVSSISFSPEEQKFRVIRSFSKGLNEKLSLAAPAVLAIRYSGQDLPYPPIDRLLESRRADIKYLQIEDLGISESEMKDERVKATHVSFPCPETRYTSLDSKLPAFERILALLKGGVSRRMGQVHSGSREEMVNRLFNILVEREILKKSSPRDNSENYS